MIFLDKFGYPIEIIKGRFINNFLRILFHTHSIRFGIWDDYQTKHETIDNFNIIQCLKKDKDSK